MILMLTAQQNEARMEAEKNKIKETPDVPYDDYVDANDD